MKYLVLIVLIMFSTLLAAQCTLTCFPSVTVDMGSNCDYTVTEFDVLDMPYINCPTGVFAFNIVDSMGNTIPDSPTIGSAYVGQTLTYTVIDWYSGSSCSGDIVANDPSGFCIPPSLIITGTLTVNQTYIATNFIQFDATIISGVSIILQAPDVFTVNGCEVQLGGELEVSP